MEVDGVSDGHSHDGAINTERTNTGRELWPSAAGTQGSKTEARNWTLGPACKGNPANEVLTSWLIVWSVVARGVECFAERISAKIPRQARPDVLHPNLLPHLSILRLRLR